MSQSEKPPLPLEHTVWSRCTGTTGSDRPRPSCVGCYRLAVQVHCVWFALSKIRPVGRQKTSLVVIEWHLCVILWIRTSVHRPPPDPGEIHKQRAAGHRGHRRLQTVRFPQSHLAALWLPFGSSSEVSRHLAAEPGPCIGYISKTTKTSRM